MKKGVYGVASKYQNSLITIAIKPSLGSSS